MKMSKIDEYITKRSKTSTKFKYQIRYENIKLDTSVKFDELKRWILQALK